MTKQLFWHMTSISIDGSELVRVVPSGAVPPCQRRFSPEEEEWIKPPKKEHCSLLDILGDPGQLIAHI